MNIDDLISEWDNDCNIDSNHLDNESIKTAKLHSKYLKHLARYKMKLAALKNDYNTLRQKKFRYYRGEMGKDELQENGWNQWQGVKPLKNEMGEFLEGDKDLNEVAVRMEYIKNVIEALESIMNQIKSRDWSIRNAIEWRKFVAGG